MIYDPQKQDKVDNSDLQPGDWRLFCPQCGYTASPNTAEPSKCSYCGAHLWMASEPKEQPCV